MDTKPWFIIFGLLGSTLLGMTFASYLVEVEEPRGQPLTITTTTTTTTTTTIGRVEPVEIPIDSFYLMWESISHREKEQLCLGWDIYGVSMYRHSLSFFRENNIRPRVHTFRKFFEDVCAYEGSYRRFHSERDIAAVFSHNKKREHHTRIPHTIKYKREYSLL